MWFSIIFIVIAIFGKFAFDWNKQGVKVNKEGGMANKYAELVEHILSGDGRACIIQQTSTLLTIGVSGPGGTTAFYLTQTFGSLNVKWKVQSPVFGNHSLEWTFPEYLDQDKMILRMNNDLEKYQMNVLRAQS